MAKRTDKQKRIALEHSIQVTEERLCSARSKVSKLTTRLERLRTDLIKLRLSSNAVFGPHTRRNKRFYMVWDTIRQRFAQSEPQIGLTHQELFEAVRADRFRLKEVTFRSYLRRYRLAGVIEKVNGRWHRVLREQSNPIEPTENGNALREVQGR